jgi:hypothetical protein
MGHQNQLIEYKPPDELRLDPQNSGLNNKKRIRQIVRGTKLGLIGPAFLAPNSDFNEQTFRPTQLGRIK